MLGLKEIKELQKSAKARREQGLFVAEGIKLFRETPPESVVQICASDSFMRENACEVEKLAAASGAEIETISDSRMAKLSDTKTPQGILLAARRPAWDTDEILKEADPLLMLLENVQDPGNLGTILRTAEAAGVTGVFLTEGCADVTGPKVIRSTVGSVYRVPHAVIPDTDDLLMKLLERDIMTYAAYLDAEASYLGGDYTKGTCFFIGNESRGLSEELLNRADRFIRIPMKGEVESLNAAMAAGILMFEAARQRR